jgi:hypothetical protein
MSVNPFADHKNPTTRKFLCCLHNRTNIADQLRNLTQSSGFKKLSQLLPELSELGINETAIKNLQQKGSTDLTGIVQKLKDLYQAIP